MRALEEGVGDGDSSRREWRPAADVPDAHPVLDLYDAPSDGHFAQAERFTGGPNPSSNEFKSDFRRP